jgi:phospholipase/carboxylesterase
MTLAVLLHGLAGSESDMQPITERIPHRSVCLRAPFPWGQGFSWFSWPHGYDDATTENATPIAQSVLDVIEAERRDDEPVLAIGWSQGATVVVEAMRLAPGVIDRAILAAGFPVRGTRPTDARLAELAPPVHWVRGAADDVVPRAEVAVFGEFLREHTRLETTVLDGVGHELRGPITDEVVRLSDPGARR